jgi:hypothetical protein
MHVSITQQLYQYYILVHISIYWSIPSCAEKRLFSQSQSRTAQARLAACAAHVAFSLRPRSPCICSSFHRFLVLLVSQMEAPPQPLHPLLTRLCSQMEAPPQSLHWLLTGVLCSQMEVPPQSLHMALCQLCSQMEAC